MFGARGIGWRAVKETRIRARRGLPRIDATELWLARDLIVLLIRREWVTKYTQTILGPLWFVIQPFGLAVVLTGAVHLGVGFKTDGVPPFLFNLCSLAPWLYFSQTFVALALTFVTNVDLFQKVYFPRLVIPLSTAAANLLALAIQTAFALAVLGWYVLQGRWTGTSGAIVLLPFVYLQLMAFTLGAGMLAAAFTARYRDLVHAVQYIVTVMLFGSLVFVPLSSIPPESRWIILLNPVAFAVESTRAVLLGTPPVGLADALRAVAMSLTILLAGSLAFERASRTAVDRA